MPRGQAASSRSRPKWVISTAGGPGLQARHRGQVPRSRPLLSTPIPRPAQTGSTRVVPPMIGREYPPESMAVRHSPWSRQKCDPNHISRRLAGGAGTRWWQISRPWPGACGRVRRRSPDRSRAVSARIIRLPCRIRPYTYQGGAAARRRGPTIAPGLRPWGGPGRRASALTSAADR
jgi:hypothetical protein